MISYELEKFCNNWLKKAETYNNETLSDCFDNFFTLYIVYNRLYVEATFCAVKLGLINLDPDKDSFPDANAATRFLLKTLDHEIIIPKIFLNVELRLAFGQIIQLIENERFHITLTNSGDARREKDLILLKDLKSNSSSKKMRSTLEIIYLIRCNLFHGHKGYELAQQDLLIPVCTLLKFLTLELLSKLKSIG